MKMVALKWLPTSPCSAPKPSNRQRSTGDDTIRCLRSQRHTSLHACMHAVQACMQYKRACRCVRPCNLPMRLQGHAPAHVSYSTLPSNCKLAKHCATICIPHIRMCICSSVAVLCGCSCLLARNLPLQPALMAMANRHRRQAVAPTPERCWLAHGSLDWRGSLWCSVTVTSWRLSKTACSSTQGCMGGRTRGVGGVEGVEGRGGGGGGGG